LESRLSSGARYCTRLLLPQIPPPPSVGMHLGAPGRMHAMAGQMPPLQPAAAHCLRRSVSMAASLTRTLQPGHGSEDGAVTWHWGADMAGLHRFASTS